MDFNVYHLIYDIGEVSYMEAVVSSTSPEQARENLRIYFAKEFFESGLSSEFLDSIIRVRLITDTNVKADKEQVLCPRTPSGLEMKTGNFVKDTSPKS